MASRRLSPRVASASSTTRCRRWCSGLSCVSPRISCRARAARSNSSSAETKRAARTSQIRPTNGCSPGASGRAQAARTMAPRAMRSFKLRSAWGMSALGNIGKYELRRQIGRGAMGVVYEAFDTVIERRVALKMLRTEVFPPEQLPEVRARLKREAHSAGKLSHPNIVTIFDYGEHDGAPFIVMDLMSGQELSRRLEAGARMPIPEAVKIIGELLAALAYAHESGVVHRDI